MRLHPGWILLALSISAPVFADTPPNPLTSDVYLFPGAVLSPASAASAGMAQADLYVADEPFENPALRPAKMVSVSGVFTHVSRQDLRGRFRSFDEQSGYFDGAGAWVSFAAGPAALFVYANQPVLRFEDNAYLTGPLSGSPAAITNSASARETRAGAGASWGRGWWALGVAGEWTNRDDSYQTKDESGSPLSGSSMTSFSGSGFGGQAGLRFELGPAGVGHVTAGAAYRFVPELTLDGTYEENLAVSGASSGPVTATRASGAEYGFGVRWVATSQLRVLGSVGGRTAQEWQGFGVTRGDGVRWGVGLDFHDARDPWTLRFGLGEESENGSSEPHNGVIGLGFGWLVDRTQLDFAVSRHSFAHLEGATSYDDRILVSVGVPF